MQAFQLFQIKKTSRLEQAFWLLLLAVYAGTFFFPLMDKDAARHANVALHMYQTGDYLSLVERGNPYLDKPHLLFWSALASFKLFGVNTFAARLPHVLYALLAIYSVYKLVRHLSDRTTAKLAALILATAQAFVLAIMDARMETPLTAGIAFGLWHLVVYIDTKLFKNLILAALGAAIAFSTKGWIGPVIIFMAAAFYILLQKKWAVLAVPKTYLFIPLFALFIAPVLYAYYVQFDLHPELVVRGTSGHKGVAFILWNQNTERFDGNTFAEGGRNSGYFFLYHTFLWAFFPWSLLAVAALGYYLVRMVKKATWRYPFNFSVLSFGVLLVLLSFSKFKMPHYIIMFFPLAAIFTAPYVRLLLSYRRGLQFWLPLHVVFAGLVVVLSAALSFYFFKPASIVLGIVGLLVLLALVWVMFKRWPSRAVKFVGVTAAFSLVLNFFLYYFFFPALMQYQAGNQLVTVLNQKAISIPDENIKLLEVNAHTFDFYRRYNHPLVPIETVAQNWQTYKNDYFIVSREQQAQLQAEGFTVAPVASQPDYNVSTITLKFLNPATRAQKLDTLLLAKIYK